MKIIIDPYRGGDDYGAKIGDKYEKDILLDLSKYMNNSFNNQNINSILTRNTDESLTDEDRVNQINKLKKKKKDLILSLCCATCDISCFSSNISCESSSYYFITHFRTVYP